MKKILITSIFLIVCALGGIMGEYAAPDSLFSNTISKALAATTTQTIVGTSAHVATATCYNTCKPTYNNYVGTVVLDLQCNATSPAQYTGYLKVNNVELDYLKTCPPPTCSMQYNPGTMNIGDIGNVVMAVTGDANGTATCNCTGLDATGVVNLGPGTYSQGPFVDAGTKNCTCTVNNGAGAGTCSGALAVLLPTVSCNVPIKSTVPPTNLCSASSGGVNINPQISLDASGVWSWGCVHSVYPHVTVNNCNAPSCLAEKPISIESSIYFDSDDEVRNAKVKLNCPGGPDICCSINNRTIMADGVEVNHICTGQVGEITVDPGITEHNAECWLKDHDIVKVSKGPFLTRTVCMERSCNSQGTCLATPKDSFTGDECNSSCRSNADCGSGRMIETRP